MKHFVLADGYSVSKVLTGALLFLAMAFSSAPAQAWDISSLWPFSLASISEKSAEESVTAILASGTQTTVFLAVDGLSYDSFLYARKQGLFKHFKHAAPHVATFPSMTDLSWATMFHTVKVFGPAGRIRSIEATHLHDGDHSIHGDTREYFPRLANPKGYFSGFQNFLSPFIEGLVYFPTQEVPLLEVRTTLELMTSESPRAFHIGYVGSVDSTAHTQKDRLYPLLQFLDSEVDHMIRRFRDAGVEPEVVLVSDHGNVGQFAEGAAEFPLVGVSLDPVVAAAGLKNVARLSQDNEVAIPLLALGNYAPIYFQDRKKMPAFVAAIRKQEWFDLALWLMPNQGRLTKVAVVSADGQATVQFDRQSQRYFYVPLRGNPLDIPPELWSRESLDHPLSAEQVLTSTWNSNYPDALFRLVESVSQEQFDFPDMIVTVKDGHFISGPLASMTTMYRTHGGLSKASTNGLFASTHRALPKAIRSAQILPFLGVDPVGLFGETGKDAARSSRESLAKVSAQAQQGVETQARNFSQRRLFQHMSRVLNETRYFFDLDEMSQIMTAFAQFLSPAVSGVANQGESIFTRLQNYLQSFDFSKLKEKNVITQNDLGVIIDVVLQTGDPNQILQDPRLKEIRDRVSASAGLNGQAATSQSGDPASVVDLAEAQAGAYQPQIVGARRVVMKGYQIPHLLERALLLQESRYLPEIRDLRFAKWWLKSKEKIWTNFHQLKKNEKSIQSLFREVWKEQELADKIYPTSLTKLYSRRGQGDITVIYVPGIYDSLFDNEIFRAGQEAITTELGLRVLKAPLASACSSESNASLLLAFLQRDSRERVVRGFQRPRYLLLGYSKGGIDSLTALAQEPKFAAEQVLGLVAIASPLHGSSILNKTDLPLKIVNLLSVDQAPQACQGKQSAARSVTPAGMAAFWRKNKQSLLGITRYFSLSFASSPEDSHVFMKATKLIAQFEEANDGVVTVTSSKFPSSLGAFDLGQVSADHLAGIASSRFPQKSFMVALVQTVLELGIDQSPINRSVNLGAMEAQLPRSAFDITRLHYRAPSLPPASVEASGDRDLGHYEIHQTLLLPGEIQGLPEIKQFASLVELNRALFPRRPDVIDGYEPEKPLPESTLVYDPYERLAMEGMVGLLAENRVQPITPTAMPRGIVFDFHHAHTAQFRMDYGFNFESRSPENLDDNGSSGWQSVAGPDGTPWARLVSNKNSIRLTTLAYRFRPSDFSQFFLNVLVKDGVKGADPVKGRSGIDDSAFQIWLTLRELQPGQDRAAIDKEKDSVVLFGYYWGDDVPGTTRRTGENFENSYSNKNIVIATLPEAYQVVINNGDRDLGKVRVVERDLLKDLARAFPDRRAENFEVVSITIQHDSNDTQGNSEALFKTVKFFPAK